MPKRSSSRLARLGGVVLLIRRQIERYWFENLFIVLSIALGAGVLTGTVQFLRFYEATTDSVLARSVRITTGRSVQADSPPIVRLDLHAAEPVTFDIDDLLELRATFPQIGQLFVTESVPTRIASVDRESRSVSSAATARDDLFTVSIVTPDSLAGMHDRPVAGHLLTWQDVEDGSHHIVLLETIARELFATAPEDVLGRTIVLHPQDPRTSVNAWTVVGIVEDDGQTGGSVMGYVPLGTGLESVNLGGYRLFNVMPAAGVRADELVRDLQAYFDDRYLPGQVDVRGPVRTDSTYIIALLALAGIALLISAVTILNLLTARVLRRQRSIGMSIALGATSQLLFWQTAGEAMVLGTGGGLLGLVVSNGLGRLLGSFLTLGTWLNIDATAWHALKLTQADIIAGLAIGITVSLLFGSYPAWLATQQQPAEALRTE